MKQAEFFYKDARAPKPNNSNLIATTMLIEYNDMLLLEHWTDSERWAIIGGSLKEDESIIECAIREVKEETGIEMDEKLAQRMKGIRKRKSISQEQLSQISGVSFGSVKRFENSGKISLLSLTKLAIALNCADEIRELFTDVPYQSIEEVIHENRRR